MDVFVELTFEAAHSLPNVPADHKCRRLHGHSYRVEVHVEGPVDETAGWVVDFDDIRRALEPVRAQLDHHHLNEVEGLENPTAERIAEWIWARLAPPLPQLSELVVRETCSAGVRYRGPDA